jgi:hypothetical protein
MINVQIALARMRDLTHQLAYHREQIRIIGQEVNNLCSEVESALFEIRTVDNED